MDPESHSYFLTLLVQSLIKRELRLAMETNGVPGLALYPEGRTTKLPTVEQVFRLFSFIFRQTLSHDHLLVRVLHPKLTTF